MGEKIDHLSAKIEQMSSQPLDQSAFTLTNYEVLRAEIDILRDEQKAKQSRVEHFVIFEELIFAISSEILGIRIEHIKPKDSL